MEPEKLFMDRSRKARSAGAEPSPKMPSRLPCNALAATEKYRMVRGSGGSVPVMAFRLTSTWNSCELENWAGISPYRPPLLARMRTLRLGEDGRSRPVGMAPSRRLLPRSSVCRSGSPASDSGTCPVSWFPDNERSRRRRRPDPMSAGMVPTTRPG
uniref:Uncharacterized protein n=1 Tax=Arundo donax TaxID=35708 RepID=A0A0A9E9A3_ARUDO